MPRDGKNGARTEETLAHRYVFHDTSSRLVSTADFLAIREKMAAAGNSEEKKDRDQRGIARFDELFTVR